ncbi:MAG: type I-E CRISPR-associated protein Cas5/CasD [Actinobacteria bacterium]|nr:type I-E CRISPR-associated protein Cas5/CasD [Actinomycetota bacterium]
MPTLVLTLAGPMQAWGTGSRFSKRQTDLAPSKSGVIGLVAAAQGLRRTEPITELVGLRFGVRADQPGRVLRDYQTARDDEGNGASVSQRYYLGDAVFLAGLESDDSEWLQLLQGYLRRPVFPLFLGRRSCPPSGPIPSEIYPGSIEEAFEAIPWKAQAAARIAQREYPVVSIETRIDAAPGSVGDARQRDIPVTFDPERREHQWREVDFRQVSLPNPDFVDDRSSDRSRAPDVAHTENDGNGVVSTVHDVFAAFPEGA